MYTLPQVLETQVENTFLATRLCILSWKSLSGNTAMLSFLEEGDTHLPPPKFHEGTSLN